LSELGANIIGVFKNIIGLHAGIA